MTQNKLSAPSWLRSQYAGISAALIAGAGSLSAQVTVPTDLELSLLIDVSGSVDDTEYALQLGGYAAAFRNASIQSAISAGSVGNIAVNAIFFDNVGETRIDWTILSNAADATAFADSLDALVNTGGGGTAIGNGIEAATTAITTNVYDGARKVIDVSGDGQNGSGVSLAVARDAAIAAGVDAINGLPIGNQSLEDYFRDNVIAGNGSFVEAANGFEDFERAVLAKLQREILGRPADDRLVLAGLRPIAISLARTMSRDVGGRLMQLRSGVWPEMEEGAIAPQIDADPKGGLSKAVIPAAGPAMDRWHVWGDLYFANQDYDEQVAGAGTSRTIVSPDSEVDIFGGSVGVDYRLNENLTLGLAFGAADGDADLDGVADVDLQSYSVMPYLSYYQRNAVGTGDLWADLLYSYVDTEYDVRGGGTRIEYEGESHQIEFNTGINFKSGSLLHGPFVQARYIDGEVDSGIDFESFATQLGYQVSAPMTMGTGTLIPQVRVAWEHEFESDQGSIAGFRNAELDEDLFVGGLGLTYVMDSGFHVGADYEARIGSDSDSHYLGLRAGFRF